MATRTSPTQILTEGDWSRGMIRDAPRSSLPDGALVDSADFLLHQPGIAIKRGGTSYLNSATGSGSYLTTCWFSDFGGSQEVDVITDNGHLYEINPSSGAVGTPSGSAMGSQYATRDKPKLWYGGGNAYAIITATDGTSTTQKYDGATANNLATGATGNYSAIYKGRICLATRASSPNRVLFGPLPDPTVAWDTTNSWIDMDHIPSGMAALRNMLLVFSPGHTERITGSIPPSANADSDMARQPVGAIGCTDSRSITVQEDVAYFANQRGVYVTNGSSFQCLTELGGIDHYWQSQLSGYDPSSWTIATGLMRAEFLLVTVMNGSSLVMTLMANLPRRAWWRLTNVNSVMFASSLARQDELYYANRSNTRVVQMAGIFTPSGSNKNDAGGAAVTPLLETRLLGKGAGLKHFGRAEISYDMRDAASDNPTMAVTIAPGVEASSYAAVAESPLLETTDEARSAVTLAKVSQGVSLKFQQSNASSKTELYAVEYEHRPFWPQAGGQ